MSKVPNDFWEWEGLGAAMKLQFRPLSNTIAFTPLFRPEGNAIAPFYTPYDPNE